MSHNILRKILPFLGLAALPFIVGSQCAFFFNSGGNSSDNNDRDKKDDTIIVVASGNLGDPAVEGLNFESGTVSGVTNKDGSFRYEEGNTVQFFLGDIKLGEPVAAKSVMAPQDLVPADKTETAADINIARLLKSLDSDPDDAVITIPKEVRDAAVHSNEEVAHAIESLDFSDTQHFTNSASQLVAVLTSGYPFTASLVDGDSPDLPKRRIHNE